MDTTFMNFADNLVSDDAIRPLMEIIEQVMSIPEESLTKDSTDVISGMIMGAFTPKMREDSIKDILENFEEQHLTRKQVQELIAQNRENVEGCRLLMPFSTFSRF